MLCFGAAAARYKNPAAAGFFYVRLKIYFKI